MIHHYRCLCQTVKSLEFYLYVKARAVPKVTLHEHCRRWSCKVWSTCLIEGYICIHALIETICISSDTTTHGVMYSCRRRHNFFAFSVGPEDVEQAYRTHLLSRNRNHPRTLLYPGGSHVPQFKSMVGSLSGHTTCLASNVPDGDFGRIARR